MDRLLSDEMQELTQRLEHAEEISRMKSSFIASMSHEIRTPMHGIVGFTELALDDNIPLKTRNYILNIKASAESLLVIINDILDVSKIESGKIELENIPFNICDVFKLCHIIAFPNAQEKEISLFCYAEPIPNKLLVGDPTRLRQIFLNLLSNAIKFTDSGGMVKLMSAVVKHTEDSVTMHFEVKDNGMGLTQDQIEKIFDPFTQANDSITRKFGGSGLGLSITKSFVELMGGKLFVESNFNVGSKFSFDITFQTTSENADQSFFDFSETQTEKPIFEGEVLVCEDNELNQVVICDYLSKVGLKSIIAENGIIAVDYVCSRIQKGEKPFDMIFMDILMPEMDGLEAAKKILDAGSRVPIIALTANIMINEKEAYFSSGMVDCLPKPFIVQELWSCLLKHLTPVRMEPINKREENSDDDLSSRVPLDEKEYIIMNGEGNEKR